MATEHRIYSIGATGTCTCELYYFDDTINEDCKTCHYTCFTCLGINIDNCTNCGTNTSTHRTINA